MQNTILIHAPGHRQGRGALVLAYTALFALLMGIWAAIFALNGQSFIQYGDTLKQHYPFLVYYGRWLRQAARCVLTGAAVSGGLSLPRRLPRENTAEAAPDDALSRDIAALMAYGREEEEENAV